jgi:solute carrier family 13 (sodium-dependent dicarboxylate transporter), member 2/3/5
MTALGITARAVCACLTQRTLLGALLGPLAGLVIWWLPLGLEPQAHATLAIVAFMLVYWIVEPIDYGLTALLGCYLFWALQVTPFSVAFSGFATTSPWFIFGVLLLGEAASRSGLARRVGFLLLHRVGTSYSRLLLGLVVLVWLLSFLIPSPNALLATLAPVALGIVTVSGWGPHSRPATGIFVILTYTCTLFGKMLMGSGPTILTPGIIEAQTGVQVLWSQWFLAFLPAVVPTVLASWLTVRWLYPADHDGLSGGNVPLQEALHAMGAWSQDEKKTLLWLLVAVSLWATDFIHHRSPAVVAIGIGLLLALPKVGVLDTKAIKQVNFLLVIFLGGALSMGAVLVETHALNVLLDSLLSWMAPWLRNAFNASIILYWANFLYHFLLGNELSLVSTSLPVLLTLGEEQGLNPVALGMLWTFAGSGKLFVYQNSALVVGYSYGYFTGRDLLKVAGILTLIEGIILMGLVSWYWPLIGLSWR